MPPNMLSTLEARARICPITRQGKGNGKRCIAEECTLWRSEWIRLLHNRRNVEIGYCTYGRR